jgi:hypothetical protein
MYLKIAIILSLLTVAIFSLGLNFATDKASNAYRRALYLLCAAHSIAIALVYYETPDKLLWALLLPSLSLVYALAVTTIERYGTLLVIRRKAIMHSTAFRVTLTACALGILLVGVAMKRKSWDTTPSTPIQDTQTDSMLTRPGPAEQADRSAWENLKQRNP